MECKWIGVFGDPTGYGKLNREIVKSLINNNVNIFVDICDIERIRKENLSKNGFNDNLHDLIALSTDRAIYFNIYSKIYTDHLKLDKSCKNIYFGMNESKNLSDNDSNRAKEFDEVWVPSDFSVTSYKQKGIQNIHKVPLGVNKELYYPRKITNDSNVFSFFSVFSWSFRKGYDVLLKSYYNNFSSDDNVELTIVSKVLGIESSDGTKHIIKCINDIKKQYNKKLPKINLITHSINENQLSNLYRINDCFVLPTRGEGFCLPLLEAAFCKLPIITTNYSGHLEFLNENNSTLLDIDGFSRVGDDKFFMSKYYNTLEFPTLSEDFIIRFGKSMRKIYENNMDYLIKSELLYEEIKNKYTWENSALTIKDRLLCHI